MTADDRRVLEWFGERPSNAFPLEAVHRWLEIPQTTILSALRRLQEQGLIRHFEGKRKQAGTWQITEAGLREYRPFVESVSARSSLAKGEEK